MKKFQYLITCIVCSLFSIAAVASTHFTVNNRTATANMGLNYRYIFAFEQIERADAQNNYSAILRPVPFLAKYGRVDVIITYDNFMYHSQQCNFQGELSSDGLTLESLETDTSYFHCHIDGNGSQQVTINVYPS